MEKQCKQWEDKKVHGEIFIKWYTFKTKGIMTLCEDLSLIINQILYLQTNLEAQTCWSSMQKLGYSSDSLDCHSEACLLKCEHLSLANFRSEGWHWSGWPAKACSLGVSCWSVKMFNTSFGVFLLPCNHSLFLN